MSRIFAILAVLGATACVVPYAGGARPVAPSAIGANYLRAAPTPVVRQEQEKDCGLAALAMVAGSWNRAWPVKDLARELDPGDSGVKLAALRDLARARGLDAYAIAATPADLERELAHKRPVVIGLVLPHDNHYNRRHYEVAIAIDPTDGTVITIDPATGDMLRRSKQILDVEWKPAAYAALVVVGDRPQLAKETP